MLLTIALMLGLCACGQSADKRWQEQYDLGVRYLSEGDYEEAVIAFTAAIEIDEKQPEAFIGRGDSYVLFGDTEDSLSAALADYETAIALNETLPDAWLGLADVYIRQGYYDKALEVLREALEKTMDSQSIAEKLAEMESGNFVDSRGNFRRLNTYGPDGTQARRASVTSYDGQGNQTGHVEMVYDQTGNQTVGFKYASDTGAVGRVERSFNGAGQATEETWYNEHDEIIMSFVRQYNGTGNVTSEEQYSSAGELQSIRYFEYDIQGRNIRQSDYDADGVLIGYYTYEYDEAGNRIKYAYYDENNQLNWYEINRYNEHGGYIGFERYDGAGNVISSSVSGD